MYITLFLRTLFVMWIFFFIVLSMTEKSSSPNQKFFLFIYILIFKFVEQVTARALHITQEISP